MELNSVCNKHVLINFDSTKMNFHPAKENRPTSDFYDPGSICFISSAPSISAVAIYMHNNVGYVRL